MRPKTNVLEKNGDTWESVTREMTEEELAEYDAQMEENARIET